MQNYEQIMQELGIEVPEDKKAELKKKMGENYKAIADYNNVVKKRDEYKTSLEDVQGKLDSFKDVDVSDLKNQISTLIDQLAQEKAGRQADAIKAERVGVIDDFLKDKKFVNPITEKAIRGSIMEELEKNNGKTVDKIFDSLTRDKDGNLIENILVDEQQEKLEAGKARFTQPKGNKRAAQTEKEKFLAMSLDERMKLKTEDPELYKKLRNS